MTASLNFPSDERMSNRDGFGEALVEAAKKNPNIWAITADLSESTRVHWFAEKFPERFVEVGVAEQNLVTVASGLAHEGKIVFASSYAAFSPGRNWEQIRTTIAYNNQPVKIVGSHGGLSVGPDGATHQALEDIALMRVLPNITVLVPADYIEAKKATHAVVSHAGPVYMRLDRSKTPVFTTADTPFEIGKANILREGTDVTIVATGSLVYEALLASDYLAKEGVSVEVINLHTIKPIDGATIRTSARKTGKVVTIEDHQIAGGLGSAIAEVLSERVPVIVKRMGVADRFGQSGKASELYKEYGLDVESIVREVRMVTASRKTT